MFYVHLRRIGDNTKSHDSRPKAEDGRHPCKILRRYCFTVQLPSEASDNEKSHDSHLKVKDKRHFFKEYCSTVPISSEARTGDKAEPHDSRLKSEDRRHLCKQFRRDQNCR